MASLGYKRLIEKKKLRELGHWELFEERGASHGRVCRSHPGYMSLVPPAGRQRPGQGPARGHVVR